MEPMISGIVWGDRVKEWTHLYQCWLDLGVGGITTQFAMPEETPYSPGPVQAAAGSQCSAWMGSLRSVEE